MKREDKRFNASESGIYMLLIIFKDKTYLAIHIMY